MAEKKCQNCKKMLDESYFINESGKVLSKCKDCRVKLVKTTNTCAICGIRAYFNVKGQKEGIRCNEHREINMINVKTELCIVCHKKQPTFNFENKDKATHCGDCKVVNMVDVMNKKCIVCKKTRSSFNFKHEKTPAYCSKCKLENMVDIVNKMCMVCDIKNPTFNFENKDKATHCGDCKLENMIDVKSKKCIVCNKKQASFNHKNDKTAAYCNDCKLENMVDIKHYKCIVCKKKRPNFAYENDMKATYCNNCKLENMIDISHPRCIVCKKKRPNFAYEKESKATHCLQCKLESMVDITHIMCIICKKRGTFGLPGTKPNHCSSHKKDGMIKNPTKRCLTKDCKEAATHGIKDPVSCETHAQKDHYNLCERKCTNNECPYPERLDILNREGLCITFCSLIKRDEMMKKHIKKKEEFIGNLLKTEIKQELSHRDQIIDSSCSKVRPDFVFDCGTHFVIIEVDEHQHKSYNNCGTTLEERQEMENKRMFMIFQSFGGPHVAFIRYNPDVFRVDNKVVNIGDQKRHQCLLRWVKHYLKNQPENPLEVTFLFYDGYKEENNTLVLDALFEKDNTFIRSYLK